MRNRPQYNPINLLAFAITIGFIWGILLFIIVAIFNIPSGAYLGGIIGGLTGLSLSIVLSILNKTGHDKFLLKDEKDKDV